MQVEGGFLDGLDLRFHDGLNVLIGGRGTGKSSVIELIRYCLDVRGSSSEEDAKHALEQALSVLQDGQVTLTVDDGGSIMMITRSANAEPEGMESRHWLPLILSQKDVESIGLSGRGRRNIVDFFWGGSAQKGNEQRLVAQVRSLTTEIRDMVIESDALSERIAGAETIRTELSRAEARSAEISKSSAQLDAKQKELEALSARSSGLMVRLDALRRAKETTAANRETLLSANLLGFGLDEWPQRGEPDPLSAVREKLARADQHSAEAARLLEEAIADIDVAIRTVERDRAPIEEQARVIRREIESLREGAGAAARQLAGLREQASQLEALAALRVQRLERIGRVQAQRGTILDRLDALRDATFNERKKVAANLSSKLMPSIRVKVYQAAQLTEYIGAITNALRGSGLRYNELAQALAESMTPRELVEAAENSDIKFISKSAKITADRAERVASQIRASGSEALAGMALEDTADFELLDGATFKLMNELSVGQRCTVVLSILLQHPDRVLIVDQPEDHLDNAFIVETLIGAIRHRSQRSQLIFSTHNANIPVLGEATNVIRLNSNGKRGFVVHAEPLNDPKSVEAITTLMEGGDEAFRKRAAFYSQTPH
ncbi:MAG TPA: AAA family ATPase [Sphingomonas sp.]|jgi:DNA repair exonuclease SbcCD ATPase subunit|nr:AAA family ATPase [Sphingomonas sp.]